MPLDAFYEAMSPTLLAQQPPSLPESDTAPGANWSAIFSHLEARRGALRNWRWSWWSYWAELARFILPRRYHWLVTANTFNRGLPLNQDIIDGTATLAMQICAAGMWTGLTSPSRPWFKLGIGLPWVQLDQEGAAWLYDTEQRVYAVLGGSNFYTTMAQAFQDVATFGTAPVIMYEDAEDLIRCYLPCAGEYYLGVGSRLTVDTLYREFTLTVLQIVEQFGLENCPVEVRGLWTEGGASLENEMVVGHAIEPNFALSDRGAGGKRIDVVPGGFTFREVYWLIGKKTTAELSRRGFHERPFFAARWSTVSNDAYGRSPGMDALGDTKQVQQETRRKAEFIEKLVRPPMGANPELRNEPSSIIPGHITYASTEGGRKGFWPLLEVRPEALKPMVDDIEKVDARVERAFFVDVFLAISRMQGVQPRNELELTQRNLERLQQLGPVIELFERDFASPAIARVLAILQRKNALLPKPASLRNVPLKIDYLSMLKLAQNAAETATMERALSVAGTMSQASIQAGVPNPLRIMNLDDSFRIYVDRLGYPAKGLFTADQVKQHDEARAAAAAQQAAAQATPALVDSAKNLSETQIGGGQTALAAMLGNAPPPQQRG